MPRRGENIYKRGDGRWEGRLLQSNGKYQYFYARTYKEVREKRKRYQDRIGKAEPVQMKNSVGLFEYWLMTCASGGVRPSTYDNYYSCMKNYVIPFFRKDGNSLITEASADEFVKYVGDNKALSEAYKRKILTIFKTALRNILKGSAYASVPETVRLPKSENAEVKVFSIKEQRAIENVVIQSESICDLGILLCFYSGIRLGELCALKWGDIDFDAGTMSVSKTVSRTNNYRQGKQKTSLLVGMPKSQKSNRRIPLPEFLLGKDGRLKNYEKDEDSYILSGSETPLDPRTCQKHYKRILNSAGVKYRKFHAIRHTFATRAMELGVDIKTLSEILGHSNVSITLNIYTHSLMEQKKIAIDKLNKLHIAHMEPASFAVTDSVISA